MTTESTSLSTCVSTLRITTLRIITLGSTHVWVGQLETPLEANFHSEPARGLFFYLLSHPEGRSKTEIFEELWGEDESPSVNNRFRVTLHRIRAALGGTDTLTEQYGRYQLSQKVMACSDLYQFYQHLGRADHAHQTGAEGNKTRLLELQKAIKIYLGDFLLGIDADWVAQTREEHKTAYVRALLELSLLYCEHGECASTVGALARALRADPYIGENYHQKLMTCLSVVEDKYASIEHYRRFIHFLRSELQDTPMRETVALAERIKGGEAICKRKLEPFVALEEHMTDNCPFTPDGRCNNPFSELQMQMM
jgi:two-component SAPR family response regulator